MLNNIDISKEKFENYLLDIEKYLKEDLSESDTRSKILDFLLISVLGWNEDDIRREGKTDTGYFDYKIKTPSIQFVVEAKRSFNAITFPRNHKKLSISSLMKGNSTVIEQIRGYLVGEGLMYGVISNGRQFVLGKFVNTDGSDWQKNICKVYDGLEDVKGRFIEFYNDLAKYSVVNTGISFAWDNEITGKTIIATLVDRDKELIRNDLSANLRPVIEAVFGEIYKAEILDNKELIEKCFVKNSETRKNKAEIEALFEDSLPVFAKSVNVIGTDKLAHEITSEITSYPVSSIDMQEPPKPIVIVGAKGAGKTTFINYLFKNSMSEDVRRNWPLVYLDFRKYDNGMDDREMIYDDILSKLDENHPYLELYEERIWKAIYQKEIAKFDKGLWKSYKKNNPEKYQEKLSEFFEKALDSKEAHLIKISEFLIQSRKMRLCVVIDNADQYDIEAQSKVYLFSQSLHRRVKCAVIVALREGYYYKWRNRPPFDAFANNVYHVSAPYYKEVLQRRINYALDKLNINQVAQGEFGDKRVFISNDKIKDFLQTLSNTLFRDENAEMLKYLEQTTYPNIRLGLESFKNFLISGHTKVSTYILTEYKKIPIWEFVKAVALDNRMYYNHELSVVNNIFYPAPGSNYTFLKVIILRYLNDKSNKEFGIDKYVMIESLLEDFELKGYGRRVVMKELNQLLVYRLIDTDEATLDTDFNSGVSSNIDYSLSIEQNICVSLCGSYYMNELLNRFHYYELVLQDSPIYDEHFFSELRRVFPKSDNNGERDLKLRKEVGELFFEYLKLQEGKEETVTSQDGVTGIITNDIFDNGLARDLRGFSIIASRSNKGG